jgi:hypothetical protein
MNFKSAQQFNQAMNAAADAARKQAAEVDRARKNMYDLANATKDAEKRFGDMKKKMDGPGIGEQAGAAFGAVTAKLNAFANVTSQVTSRLADVGKAAALMGDAQLDAAQKSRLLAESIPVVGGMIKSFNEFKDGITGVTTALQYLQRDLDLTLQKKVAQQEFYGAERSGRLELAGARGQAVGLSGQALVEQTFGSTATAQGQREYQAQLARQPALLAQRTARAEIDATKFKVKEIEKLEKEEQGRLERARMQESEAAGRLRQREVAEEKRQRSLNKIITSGPVGLIVGAGMQAFGSEDRVGRSAAKIDTQKAITDQLNAQNNLLSIQEQKKQAAVQLAKAESDLRKSAIELDKSRVGYLDQQMGLIKSQSTAYGLLNAAEREALLQTVEQVKKHGLGSASEEQRGLLHRGGFSEYLQNEAFKNAERDPRIAKAREALGIKGDFASLEKERNEAQARILKAVQLDEQKYATQTADAFDKILTRVFQILGERLDAKFREIEARIATLASFR